MENEKETSYTKIVYIDDNSTLCVSDKTFYMYKICNDVKDIDDGLYIMHSHQMEEVKNCYEVIIRYYDNHSLEFLNSVVDGKVNLNNVDEINPLKYGILPDKEKLVGYYGNATEEHDNDWYFDEMQNYINNFNEYIKNKPQRILK